MLQIYDRVITSRSVPTLLALFLLITVLFSFMAAFDFLRSKVLSRTGIRLDVELMSLAKEVWLRSGLRGGMQTSRPIDDLSVVRQFIGSQGLSTLFDIPWAPAYLAIIYLLHSWLGLLATAGAIFVVATALLAEWLTKRPLIQSSSIELEGTNIAEQARRNVEPILAMGMTYDIINRWTASRKKALRYGQIASGHIELISAITRSSRMLLQSGILALGAYLAILQQISPGAMIAASILAGRALAPIDMTVGNWRNIARARQAWKRLSKVLTNTHAREQKPVKLPTPKGNLAVSSLTKLAAPSADGERVPIVQNLKFSLTAGEGLGVIGPSASGKSSLAKLLVGLWKPDHGEVRFDGAAFDQWDPSFVGKYIGYLPQSVELMTGTIRDNIARFDDNVSDEEVVEAAKLANVHELVLALPDGYSTEVGDAGVVLSGGQVQRIGLARALLRSPPLIVLDEPNSNLDGEGELALTQAISRLRDNGSCVVVMAHRPSAIAAVDKILVLKAGRQVEFGPKEEVLRKVTRPVARTDLKAAP